MRSRIPLFFLLLTAGAFALPHLAHATGIPFYGPILPHDIGYGDSGASGTICTGGWGGFLQVINNIVALLITLGFTFIAPLSIAYAGFLMVFNPISSENITKGRKILISTVVGIVISLAAWLIVDAILSGLSVQGLSAWTATMFSTSGDCLYISGGLSQGSSTVTNNPPATVTPVQQGSGNEATVRARLAAAGIGINHDPCPDGSNGQGCTNVGGLQESTIEQAIAIAKGIGITSSCSGNSSCGLIITGGNEPGHAAGTYSHGNGYKLDLHPTGALDSFLQSLTSEGMRYGDGLGPAYTDKCTAPQYNPATSNQYVRESDHWDIRITSVCDPLK